MKDTYKAVGMNGDGSVNPAPIAYLEVEKKKVVGIKEDTTDGEYDFFVGKDFDEVIARYFDNGYVRLVKL